MSETNLPDRWRKVELGEVCHKPEYGLTTSASTAISAYKLLRITDIQEDGVDWATVPYCESLDELKESHKLRPNDVVIARIGATTGKAFFIRDCPEAVFASYLIRIRTKSDLNSEYLGFYFQTEDYWKHIDQNKGGRLKGGVNIPILQGLSLLLPPLPEQNAIARALRAVQEAKAARQKELVLERERKAALMQHLFTYGTRGEARKQTEIGEMPESWKVVSLGQVSNITTGTTPATDKAEYYSGSIAFIKTAEIANNKITQAETYISKQAVEDYKLKIYPSGSIFMAMYGQGKTRGQVSLLNISAATTQNTAAILPAENLDSEFAWQWLLGQYQNLRNAGSHGHISHLNLSYVKAYKICLPVINEQREIAQILQNSDNKIIALEKELISIDELFRAMLEELMTGKLSTQPLIE